MNNREQPVRYTAVMGNVGTIATQTPFATPFAPPTDGWLYRVTVEVQSGASTTATIVLIGDDGGSVVEFGRWPNYTLPFDAADVPISWQVALPNHIQLLISTDDGSQTSVLDVAIVAGAS